jgi:hypothetical protein
LEEAERNADGRDDAQIAFWIDQMWTTNSFKKKLNFALLYKNISLQSGENDAEKTIQPGECHGCCNAIDAKNGDGTNSDDQGIWQEVLACQ